MAVHRLEVYLDSYNSEPFVADFNESVSLSSADERKLEKWISRISGRPIDILKNLKIADVRHRKATAEHFEATCLRIKLVP